MTVEENGVLHLDYHDDCGGGWAHPVEHLGPCCIDFDPLDLALLVDDRSSCGMFSRELNPGWLVECLAKLETRLVTQGWSGWWV